MCYWSRMSDCRPTRFLCAFNVLRALLLLFNLLLWLTGLLVMLTAVWMQTDLDNFLRISTGYSTYAPYALLIVGAIMLFAASLACSCIVKVDPNLLVIYGGFLIGSMFTLILLSIYIYAYKDSIIIGLPNGIRHEVFTHSSYNSFNSNFKSGVVNDTLIDYVQKKLNCCGSVNHQDWPQGALPKSCCWSTDKLGTCNSNKPEYLHQTGCLSELVRLLGINLASIGALLSVLSLFPLITMVLAYSLASVTPRMTYERIL